MNENENPEWLDSALTSATGNMLLYSEYKELVFDFFKKMQDLVYTDDIVLAMAIDRSISEQVVKLMFNMWKAERGK